MLGDVVNTASRVEAVTEPDQILMTGSTWAMVKDQFKTRKVATSTLKGRRADRAVRIDGVTPASVADRDSVLSPIRSTAERFGTRIDQNRLVSAVGAATLGQTVAHRRQLGADVLRDTVLERKTGGVVEARRISGGLDVHFEVNQVEQHLDVSLRLVVAAHDSK